MKVTCIRGELFSLGVLGDQRSSPARETSVLCSQVKAFCSVFLTKYLHEGFILQCLWKTTGITLQQGGKMCGYSQHSCPDKAAISRTLLLPWFPEMRLEKAQTWWIAMAKPWPLCYHLWVCLYILSAVQMLVAEDMEINLYLSSWSFEYLPMATCLSIHRDTRSWNTITWTQSSVWFIWSHMVTVNKPVHEHLDGWTVGGTVGLCCPMDKALLSPNPNLAWELNLISTAD